jgi:hypothetical protein
VEPGDQDEQELGKLGGAAEDAEESAAIRRWLRLARRILGGGEDETTSSRERGRSSGFDDRSSRR